MAEANLAQARLPGAGTVTAQQPTAEAHPAPRGTSAPAGWPFALALLSAGKQAQDLKGQQRAGRFPPAGRAISLRHFAPPARWPLDQVDRCTEAGSAEPVRLSNLHRDSSAPLVCAPILVEG